MVDIDKPRSPFQPGQPARVEVFVGRSSQIERLLQRGAQQTAQGKPTMFFIEGEYGIGKSSLANYCMQWAERELGLVGITASLAGQRDVPAVIESILQATITAATRNKGRWALLRERFGKFIKSANLFGFDIDFNTDLLRAEAAHYTDVISFLGLLGGVLSKLMTTKTSETDTKGIFLVLDEINGVASEPMFAHFLKGIVDRNALADRPIPFCLVLCGTPERRRQLIESHEPVGRIFDIIAVEPLSDAEARRFFERTFQSVGMRVEPSAMDRLVALSFGQPRILHMLGDAAYWRDTDRVVDEKDVMEALSDAARDFTSRFVGPQILDELRSPDYRSILRKIGKLDPLAATFGKATIAEGLNEKERKKLDNFLQRMQKLRVLRKGKDRGEWVFNTPLVRTAVFLLAEAEARSS